MKHFSILAQTLVFTLIVSACGAQATPTIDPADQYSTAVAAALTVLAETRSALPTDTLSPPTVTFTSTRAAATTLPPLLTLGATFTPSPVVQSNSDPCINTVLPTSLTGQKIKIRIDNPTKGTINLTVYLQSGNPQGVCGYRAYVLAPGDSLVINDLIEGCYSLWAWNPEPDEYFMVTNGTSCLNGSQNWTFDILPGSIRLRE